MRRCHIRALKTIKHLVSMDGAAWVTKEEPLHREYNRVQVVCMDIPKMAACERSQMGLRTIFESI